MEQLNRALAILVAVVLFTGGAIVALVAAEVIAPSSVAPAGWFRQGLQEIAWLTTINRVAVGGLGAICAGAGVILAAAELVPVMGRRYMSPGKGSDREFIVRENEVEQMVRYAGQQVEQVVAVEDARVSRDEQGLEVACKVILEPYTAAGPLAAILEARIRNAVYTMTGLSVGRVHLRIRHAKGRRLVSARR